MGGSRRPRPAIPFRFRWVQEAEPGPIWTALYERTWAAYSRWFLKDGDKARPDLEQARTALERHMPELVPIWERLVALTDGNEQAARMLSLYRPTPYITGCSQAVWSRGEPALVRNYDYHPGACEGTFLHSTWSGTPTLASSDCLWGVVDGINQHGLVVSLAFGGRREVGDGFGIPIILRYVLETCASLSQAVAVLRRIPSHMSYNVSILDPSGERVVAAVAPDRSTSIQHEDIATNHQRGFEWSKYDRFSRSAERESFLIGLLKERDLTLEGFSRRFLRLPLYKTSYDRACGTIFTCVYRPLARTVTYLWPSQQVDQSLAAFESTELELRLGARD